MVFGAHVVVYSKDAEAGRTWLIFALPPAELAVHPAEANGRNELYLMCEDLRAEMRGLEARGIRCADVQEERWGLVTRIALPGGGELGLYRPRHATALGSARPRGPRQG